MNVTYVRQGHNILIGYNGTSVTVNPTHFNYENIITAIDEGRLQDLPMLADVALTVETFGQGLIKLENGVVTYNNEPVHNVICDRIIQMIKAKVDVAPVVLFLENLMTNPSETAINEAYLFMEHNDLPITPDGHLLAYKKVRDDYKDIHSGTFDNSIGQICEMDRGEVDPNRDSLCSTGLHFCGLSYLNHFGSNNYVHVMILKINPRDIVSIPRDYGNAKGRTSRYEVVGEYTEWSKDCSSGAFDNNPVVSDYSAVSPSAYDIAQCQEKYGPKEWLGKIFMWFADKVENGSND